MEPKQEYIIETRDDANAEWREYLKGMSDLEEATGYLRSVRKRSECDHGEGTIEFRIVHWVGTILPT
jgi:hypothetical protein